MSESVPNHSTSSRIRTRIDVQAHQEAFGFVLQILASKQDDEGHDGRCGHEPAGGREERKLREGTVGASSPGVGRRQGYHSNATMKMANEVGLRSYISEPKHGRRRWRGKEAERDGAYANRQRLQAKRGRELMRRRCELLERCFADCLETGGMRRVLLRGRENILKRYSVHVAAISLSLVMRFMIGVGTPRGLQNGLPGLAAVVCAWVQLWIDVIDRQTRLVAHRLRIHPDLVAA